MINVIDMHCDTLVEDYLNGGGLRGREGHLNLEKIKAAGGMAQCFAAWITEGEAAERSHIQTESYEMFQKVYQHYLEELERNADILSPAYCAEDVKKNAEEGKLSAILTLEDCMLLKGKLERVDELAEKGVRMATLIWNYENSLGYPNHTEAPEHKKGLKPFGIEAVERMNEKGIIVDVSHLSEGGFYDVAKYCKKPFAASHSCARALCDHPRNLDDDQLAVIGEKGGVVGINFYSAFLTRDSDYASNSRIAEHAVYVADKAGIEALALGSDFDGIGCELEMKDYSGLPGLIDELSKHFGADDIDKITHGNFLRVFRECAGR